MDQSTGESGAHGAAENMKGVPVGGDPFDTVVTVPESRSRTLTERGRLYKIEQHESRLKPLCRLASKQSDTLNCLIEQSTKSSIIRQVYASWLDLFEQFLEQHDSYISLLNIDETDLFSLDRSNLRLVKESVEKWFLKQSSANATSDVEPGDSVSQVSKHKSLSRVSHHGSVTSSVSSARLREDTKKAELSAQLSCLEKQHQLEMEKLQLKMKEDRLKIQTELAITDARSKVIDEYTDVNTRLETSKDFKTFKKTDTRQSKSEPKPYPLNFSKSTSNPNTQSYHVTHSTVQNVDKHAPNVDQSNVCNVNDDMHVQDVIDDMSHLNVTNTNYCDNCPNDNANANSYVRSVLDSEMSSTAFVDSMMMSFVRHMRKPMPEIKRFSGNPLEYPKFIRQFKTKVVANTEDYDERLNYLDQFTDGEANKIVNGFAHLEAKKGYTACLKELEARYGSSEVIANAYVRRALEWPAIKSDSPKALDEFAIFLTECNSAIQGMESVKVLQYPDNIKLLVKKLPVYFHDKWRNIVLSVKENHQIIKFSDLVNFVKREASKATDPTYGREALKTEAKFTTTKGKDQKQSKSKSAFSTTVKESSSLVVNPGKESNPQVPSKITSESGNYAFRTPCLYCSSDQHCLNDCNNIVLLPNGQRVNFLKLKGLCFGCLKFNHIAKQCKARATCKVCERRHPTICHDESYAQSTSKGTMNLMTSDVKPVSTACMSRREGVTDCSSTMAIVPVTVKLKGGLKTVKTYAFLDTGSSVSFCSESLMHELGANGRPVNVTLDTIGSPCAMQSYVVQGLEIGDIDSKHMFQLPTVYSKSKIPVGQEHIPTMQDISRWPHLKRVNLPVINSEIGLLLGNNIPNAYLPLEVITSPEGCPHATRSRLGWIVWNLVRPLTSTNITVNRADVKKTVEVEMLNDLDRLVRHSINMDFPERSVDDQKQHSQEDKKFLQKINSTIQLKNGHYYISLPFRDDNVTFPNNASQALRRLESLKSKMNSNPEFKRDYQDFMSNVLEKNYAERVPDSEVDFHNGKIWYIPHHGVYHPKKPNKLRVVFDCTASFQGVSLNKALLPGPDLTNTLLGVLLRFRQEPVAIMSDVESMYYQVRVPVKHRDCLRFYWWINGDTDQSPVPYRMCVHLFGATSSPSCATAALQQVARDNKEHFSHTAIHVIMNNFYVDDCLTSADSTENAIQLVKELTDLCQLGGFHLTKWLSNDHEVMHSIPVSERAKEVRDLDLSRETLPSERALGVHWNVESDTLGFNIKPKDFSATRRGILSLVSSTFDPLGIASPFILMAKIVLQELCKQGVDWDEEVSGNLLETWKKWCEELPLLTNLKIDRCYKPRNYFARTCQMHVFSDSSDHGYGVAIYLRFTSNQDQTHCVLVQGRSRVAPLKKVTTPRMELTAATLAVRTSILLMKELEYHIDDIFYWTDSMAVLRYIANESSRFHTFVANRVAVIREASEVRQWHYVDTNNNPADYASRGMTVKSLLQHTDWLNGPHFLWMSEEEWPEFPVATIKIDYSDPEIKKPVCAVSVVKNSDVLDTFISHYSDWHRLKKAVSWLLVAMNNLKKRAEQRKKYAAELQDVKLDRLQQKQRLQDLMKGSQFDSKEISLSLKGLVTPNIYVQAEEVLVRYIQRIHYSEEIHSLSSCQRPHVKKSSSIFKLDPTVVDGIIRVGGRLERANVPYEAKHPVILPKSSKLTPLILRYVHQSVGHQGKNAMLSFLRQRYWITGVTSAIKTLISKCVICRRYQSRVGQQKMADLPKERVVPDLPCFANVGMDYFGPIEVKRGRSKIKRYGVIFTCLNSRAVHLEIACSLDTDSCINCIRRFIARRGPVKSILSDNGSNLVGSQRELESEIKRWNHSKIQDALLQKEITWNFNPPLGSHFGGIWERMIRSIRKVLYSLLKEQNNRLDDESLQTLFCEVESILNNRPISSLPNEPGDLNALTPNHILLLQPGETLPPGLFSKTDCYVKRRWKQVQYLANLFWTRWIKEYLPLLQERQKWCTTKRNVQINDIVLLVDSCPRNSWALGRVLDIMKDKRGFVRMVKVKTKSSVFIRPIDKMCLILEADY